MTWVPTYLNFFTNAALYSARYLGNQLFRCVGCFVVIYWFTLFVLRHVYIYIYMWSI